MTVETFTPAAPYTVAGIGPYAIAHPYLEGSIRIFTTVGEVEVQLPPTDYSLSPLAATVAGNLFLTPAAAAAQAGRALRIRRVTAQEQGWVGVQGEREKGLERQLDRLTYAVQEGSALLDRTLRTRDPIAPFVPQTGRTLLFDGTAIVAGPNAMDIADAQANAAAALASQVAAAGSAAAAAGSASQAAASAATINLPAITGQALNFLRANAGATGLEYRTPAQVRSDLGGTTVGQNLFTAADAAAGRTALGATATGSALFTAADPAAGRTALEISQNLGFNWSAPQTAANNGVFDFTGIPSWATEICARYGDLTVNTTVATSLTLQVGNSGGIISSGYTSGRITLANGVSPSGSFTLTDQFGVATNISGGGGLTGDVTLKRIPGSNYWTINGMVGRVSTGEIFVMNGSVFVTNLDRIRFTRVNTTMLHTAGTTYIGWR
jgi:hypothetical protein